MITYVRKRFKGSGGQESLQQVADVPVMDPIKERAQFGVRTVVIGLAAPSQVIRGPQPKRSKGRVNARKARSSAHEQSRLPGKRKNRNRLVSDSDSEKALASVSRARKRVVSNSDSEKATASVSSARKRVAATADFDSEKTTVNVSQARRQPRRRLRNGRQEGKLNDKVLSKYLGNLWQTIPTEKKNSCTYIDCLWFVMYQEGDREKALRWIRRERIFSKKYVFLPICKYNHWSLVIFCHLGEDLQSKTKTPCMLLLDSLHIPNLTKSREKDIKKFLLDIYEDEGISESTKQIDKIPLLAPKVPQQTGDKECGYYVLYYITQFLKKSPETFSISGAYPYFMQEDWFTAKDVESFRKTLPSSDQETGLGYDLSDGGSDDVVLILD